MIGRSFISPSIRVSQPVLLLVAAVCVSLLPGCGYGTRTTFDTSYKSVAVAMFNNRSFYRGVEFDLSEALAKEIELRTPYKVVSPDAADTLIEGTIVNVQQHMLSRRDPGGLPQEMEIELVIDFTWKDQRTGRVLRERQGMRAIGRYAPTAGINEPFETGQHASVQKAATMIVSVMHSDW